MTTTISVSEARAFAQEQQIIFDQVHANMLETQERMHREQAKEIESARKAGSIAVCDTVLVSSQALRASVTRTAG